MAASSSIWRLGCPSIDSKWPLVTRLLGLGRIPRRTTDAARHRCPKIWRADPRLAADKGADPAAGSTAGRSFALGPGEYRDRNLSARSRYDSTLDRQARTPAARFVRRSS